MSEKIDRDALADVFFVKITKPSVNMFLMAGKQSLERLAESGQGFCNSY